MAGGFGATGGEVDQGAFAWLVRWDADYCALIFRLRGKMLAPGVRYSYPPRINLTQ